MVILLDHLNYQGIAIIERKILGNLFAIDPYTVPILGIIRHVPVDSIFHLFSLFLFQYSTKSFSFVNYSYGESPTVTSAFLIPIVILTTLGSGHRLITQNPTIFQSIILIIAILIVAGIVAIAIVVVVGTVGTKLSHLLSLFLSLFSSAFIIQYLSALSRGKIQYFWKFFSCRKPLQYIDLRRSRPTLINIWQDGYSRGFYLINVRLGKLVKMPGWFFHNYQNKFKCITQSSRIAPPCCIMIVMCILY